MTAVPAHDSSTWHGPLEVPVTVETTLGLLAAFFLGFFTPVVMGLLILVAIANGRLILAGALFPLLLATGSLAVTMARMAAEASMGQLTDTADSLPCNPQLPKVRLPFALAMAARLPHYALFLRPWIGLWWSAHFCVAAAIGHNVAIKLIKQFDVATFLLAMPLAVVVHFAFLFAGNLYLILAARAMVTSPRFCVRVWKYRFLIDFIVALMLVAQGLR